MGSQAQEVLRKLLNDAETIRNVALREAKSISVGDASSIFESLAEKIKSEGNQRGESSTLKRLFDFCGVRNELISQLLSFVEKLPHKILPLTSVTLILKVTNGTTHDQTAKRIINEWSISQTNKGLAAIAGKKLKTKQ
jgi:hypothetical protein